MNNVNGSSKVLPVVLAAAVVVVLAGSLGARLIIGDLEPVPKAPRGAVPQARALVVGDLEVPCWTCPSNKGWALRFQTDLDLLAPLGEGSGNAAEWFAQFAKEVGPRAAELSAAREDRVDGPEWVGRIFPADHPLLREAEPWCDQAKMGFYPEIFPLEGSATRITDLLFALDLVRSWTARGLAAEDGEAAMADLRRAIRLGRLLRQEDVVVINDLVGLACIHIATRGVYQRAIADGNLELALLASVVLGEVAPQRLRTSERITATDLSDSISDDGHGGLALALRPGKLEAMIEAAQGVPDRRFRCEAIVGLNTVRWLGTAEERDSAFRVLDWLAADADPVIAEGATWSRDTTMTREQLTIWTPPPK
jgi:hypothetical protein